MQSAQLAYHLNTLLARCAMPGIFKIINTEPNTIFLVLRFREITIHVYGYNTILERITIECECKLTLSKILSLTNSLLIQNTIAKPHLASRSYETPVYRETYYAAPGTPKIQPQAIAIIAVSAMLSTTDFNRSVVI